MTGAGDFREKIAFDQLSADVDADGGVVPGEWEEQFQRSARVKPLRGGEPVIAQRLQGVQPVIITVLSSTETRQITPAWRARDTRTNAVYQLRAVTPDEIRREIDILAESGMPVEDGS